ncbi:MAG: hypothetical protein ABI882_04600 [Acidobacteriota bacterium]
MSDKDAFKERERALEDGYFLKREKELIEKMRRRTALETERRQIAEQIGVTNDEILEALQSLGYTPETVKLLPVMPLIHVAWANGKISPRERRMIIDVARASDIEEGSEADRRLETLLNESQPEAVWDANFLAMRAVLESLPAERRDEMRQSVLTYCTSLAALSKGLFGFDTGISAIEKEALERVIKEMAPPESDAARKILEGLQTA